MAESIEINNDALLRRIENFRSRFNWKELPEDLKKSIEVVFDDAKTISDKNQLSSIENWLHELYVEFKTAKCRYINLSCVDRFNKYTPFYSFVRNLYENAFPVQLNDLKKYPWPIIDFAIIQLEIDLQCALRGEIDLDWDKKYTEKYSESSAHYLEFIVEFIDMLNIVEGVDDYFVLEIIEKYYFDGVYPNGNHETSEDNLFVCRRSYQKERFHYQKAWENCSYQFAKKVSTQKKEIEKVITTKYNRKELMIELKLDENQRLAFYEWYDRLTTIL